MTKTFLPKNFELKTWETINSFFQELINQEIDSTSSLETWLKNRSELDAFLSENFAWRYIKMSCNTIDENLEKDFKFFVEHIQPHLQNISNELDKKFLDSKYINDLDKNLYGIYLRGLKKSVEIFREENIPLLMEEETLSQEYGKLSGKMMVKYKGEDLTIQAATQRLESTDRTQRKAIYHLIWDRRLENKNDLDEILTKLIKLRQNIAKNAGFKNYRDYKFMAMGRFDYSAKDCENFHDAVAKHIVPFSKKLIKERQTKLNLDKLKPWDLAVDPDQKKPLTPFKNSDELIEKMIKGFNTLDQKFGAFIKIQQEKKFLDLDSRPAKRPGGFNYPLYESGIPFIFMNSVGSQRDLETMVHEGGHAIHSFLVQDLPILYARQSTTEIAELASMAMEMFSMDFWNLFYENEENLNRAKRKKIEESLTILPWIAQVDKFQHWMYTNPDHTSDERKKIWENLSQEFGTGLVDFSDCPDSQSYRWQTQLHIFEVPFYYIEYGFCQLGSIAMWKNFKKDKTKTIKQYEKFMRLGSTKTIPETYKAAGIVFDFSPDYIRDLMSFVENELSNY